GSVAAGNPGDGLVLSGSTTNVRRGIEGHPAGLAEADLHPGVSIGSTHFEGAGYAVVPTGQVSGHHPSREAGCAPKHGHGRSELLAETSLLIEEKCVDSFSPIRQGRDIEVVGEGLP